MIPLYTGNSCNSLKVLKKKETKLTQNCGVGERLGLLRDFLEEYIKGLVTTQQQSVLSDRTTRPMFPLVSYFKKPRTFGILKVFIHKMCLCQGWGIHSVMIKSNPSATREFQIPEV